MNEPQKSPEVEEIEVECPAEPELKPDVVLDEEDDHAEGVDARDTGEQPPLGAEGPEPGMPAQSKEEVAGDAEASEAE